MLPFRSLKQRVRAVPAGLAAASRLSRHLRARLSKFRPFGAGVLLPFSTRFLGIEFSST